MTVSPSVIPFLAGFATARTDGPRMEGDYCAERDLWMVDGPDGPTPIVEMRDDAGQTSTITRVRTEADDTDISPVMMVSTTTSTKINVESEDTDVSQAAVLEVTTKTNAQVERDDVANRVSAFDPQVDPEPRLVLAIQ